MAIFDWFKKDNGSLPTDPRKTYLKIEKDQKILFKGMDGRSYENPEDLFEANKAWMREHYKYKAMDGSTHSDWKDVEEANLRYMETMYKFAKEDYINPNPKK